MFRGRRPAHKGLKSKHSAAAAGLGSGKPRQEAPGFRTAAASDPVLIRAAIEHDTTVADILREPAEHWLAENGF